MSSYKFRYRNGQSAPYESLIAANDAEFFGKLAEFEDKPDRRHIPGTIVCLTDLRPRKVEEAACQ